jgi:pimeloyl-ACP methyl ester carboxylesterase
MGSLTRLIPYLLASALLGLGSGCGAIQRKLLFHPTHDLPAKGLDEWKHGHQVIGFARTVPAPGSVWLFLHGNGGQAAYRGYALPCFAPGDSVYILEYPGYGQRPGIPSRTTLDAAAREAYERLCMEFPNTPVCVVGESIGTGPASSLASAPRPPDKIVLIVPFAVLRDVVGDHVSFLPAGLLAGDSWDNIGALKGYEGPLELFAAKGDTIIPIRHARALAASRPQAVIHEFEGGHNDWPSGGRVTIRNP